MTYIVHPSNEAQEKAVKAVLEALQVPFEEEPEAAPPYSEEFEARMKRGEEDIKAGRGKIVTLNELNELWK